MHLAIEARGQTSPNPLVGCVIVKNGETIGEGFHAAAGEPHAERVALDSCTEDPRGATLYVTLEPCTMCAGAIVLSRIPRVVYATPDPKAGAVDSVLHVLSDPHLNHRPEVISGVLAADAADLLRSFFRARR